jgi:hypothetical protein
MFCRNCGTQIKEEAKFCPNCGTKTEAGAPQQVYQQPVPPAQVYQQPVRQQQMYQQPAPQRENSKVLLLVAAIFGILFMIGVATGESFLNAILDRKISELTILDKKTTELPQMVLVTLEDLDNEKEKLRLLHKQEQLLREQMALQFEIAKLAKVLLIPLLCAVILNLAAWLKAKAKIALAAGILYVISLNIISAVLCFIGYEELKRNTSAKPGIVT